MTGILDRGSRSGQNHGTGLALKAGGAHEEGKIHGESTEAKTFMASTNATVGYQSMTFKPARRKWPPETSIFLSC